MNKRRIALLLLLSVLTSATTSCSGDAPDPVTDTSSSEPAQTETTAPAYEYPAYDGEGDEFVILTPEPTYGFYTTLDTESEVGEALDDTVFRRNRGIEERFNIEFRIVEEHFEKVHTTYRTSIEAGDHEFDIGFIRSDLMSSFISNRFVYNLLDYDEFHLDEPYYDQNVNAAARQIDSSTQLFASTYTNLIGADGLVCTFFNESMLDKLGMDTPYQLVRDGKWTLDVFGQYMKAGANLNGDDSFTWNDNGKATYGMATWATAFQALLTSCDVSLISFDDGAPSFGANERFYNVLDKIETVMKEDGFAITGQGTRKSTMNYELIFQNGRSLMLIAELKASSKYRDMDDTYGIVPLPKYDEKQKEYYTFRTSVEPLLTVPITHPDPASAGIIMDAMAYESYANVLPVYYEYRMNQKQLRNDESIEMLEMMRTTMIYDIGMTLGWTTDLMYKLRTLAATMDGGYSSTIASYESKIDAAIEKTMTTLNQK